MTVIFGFTNINKKTCFMGADDLEGHSKKRVDKIIRVFGRFVVGCVGANMALDAARVAGILWSERTLLRDLSEYKSIDSLDDFANSIAACVGKIVAVRYQSMMDAVEKGVRTKEQMEHLCSQNSTLVVLDTLERKIHELRFGKLFPPSTLNKIEIVDYPQDRIFRFGVNGTKDHGSVTKEANESPFAWCKEQVCLAKQEVEPNVPGAIGELGCCYLVRGSRVTFKTAFESIEDASAHLLGLNNPRPGWPSVAIAGEGARAGVVDGRRTRGTASGPPLIASGKDSAGQSAT